MNTFYSNGKLLLNGEYLVLDGALAMAVPTKFGQSLKVKPIDGGKVVWRSFDNNGNIWFKDEFDIKNDEILNQVQNGNLDFDLSKRLIEILNTAKKLNPSFLNTGFEVETYLDFPRNWGLGTSSTLINNIANWAQVDAYQLLDLTFGGSGYDIACAQHNSPITYQKTDTKPIIEEVEFNPSFCDRLFFIHLNQKQDSRQGIAHYNSKKENIKESITEINRITKKMIDCKTLSEFESLINKHETIISKILGIPTVKENLFPDYKGSIKSLGAWGGDFILATGSLADMDYFKKKGYQTVLNFDDMVLS